MLEWTFPAWWRAPRSKGLLGHLRRWHRNSHREQQSLIQERTSFKPRSFSCAARCCALCRSGCQSEAVCPAAVDALPLACSSGLPGHDASYAFPNTPYSLGKYRLVPGVKNVIQCLRARDLAAFWWWCSNMDLALGTGTAALQPDPKACQHEWKHLLHQGCGDGSSPPWILKYLIFPAYQDQQSSYHTGITLCKMCIKTKVSS